MIDVRPWEDLAAMSVFAQLDPEDHLEAELVRGVPATHLALWGDWRAMSGAHIAGYVFAARGIPFAVGALANTGQAGVAEAALVARDHVRFRRPLTELAARIRAELPEFCARLGIHRIEARSWAGHPRAARFLGLIGFRHEADLPGFGASGAVVFRQFAWVDPAIGPAIASPITTEDHQPCA